MVGILISDSIPNTFFAHIFKNKLGSLIERIESQHLPRPFRKIASMMCSKCFLEISANLTEQPRVEISAKSGARVELAGDVLLQFQGREELHSLINATTRLHVTLKPTIRHSRLYGDIALTNVDVKVY
ncbi:BPI2 domain-containing protein, partial [Trichostrongylus colubriformis]